VHSEILREVRLYTEDNSNEAPITPIPVHADIAARVSATRETVARVLSDLTKQNILKREKDALMVLGLERLENLIDEARQ
jgi:CRP/FNR family cyclic AMP-dependent transcriptional regulator